MVQQVLKGGYTRNQILQELLKNYQADQRNIQAIKTPDPLSALGKIFAGWVSGQDRRIGIEKQKQAEAEQQRRRQAIIQSLIGGGSVKTPDANVVQPEGMGQTVRPSGTIDMVDTTDQGIINQSPEITPSSNVATTQTEKIPTEGEVEIYKNSLNTGKIPGTDYVLPADARARFMNEIKLYYDNQNKIKQDQLDRKENRENIKLESEISKDLDDTTKPIFEKLVPKYGIAKAKEMAIQEGNVIKTKKYNYDSKGLYSRINNKIKNINNTISYIKNNRGLLPPSGPYISNIQSVPLTDVNVLSGKIELIDDEVMASSLSSFKEKAGAIGPISNWEWRIFPADISTLSVKMEPSELIRQLKERVKYYKSVQNNIAGQRKVLKLDSLDNTFDEQNKEIKANKLGL